MDGPAIITQVTNPKEDEGRARGAGEKGERGRGRAAAGGGRAHSPRRRRSWAPRARTGLGEGCARSGGCVGVGVRPGPGCERVAVTLSSCEFGFALR